MLLGFLNVFGMYSKYFAKRVPLYDICCEVHQCSYSILSIPSYFIIYYNTACINQSLRTTGILQGKWPKTQKMSSLP